MARLTNNRLKMGKTPVIRKDLEGGVIAEANNDGSIYVDKDVKPGSPLEKEAIAHEKVHLNQMKRGDLNYDDNNVYWKGKAYPRSSMNEGAKNLPWEKEAYDKTKHIGKNKKNSPTKMSDADLVANNKQVHSRFKDYSKGMPTFSQLQAAKDKKEDNETTPTKMKANPITYKASALKNTIAAKEFLKDYAGNDIDPPKTTVTKKRGIKDGKVGTETTVEKAGTKTTTTGSRDPYDGSGGYMGNRKWKKWYNSPAGADYRSKYTMSGDPKPQTVTTPPVSTTSFKPEVRKEPGTPGEEGKYQMGYFEAANLAASKRVQNRKQKQAQRKRQRDDKRFARYKKQERSLYDDEGRKIETPEEYRAYRAKTSFGTDPSQVGVVSGGTLSKQPTVVEVKPGDPGTEGLTILDNASEGKSLKTGLFPSDIGPTLKTPKKLPASANEDEAALVPLRSRSSSATPYNASNKNKSAFKMNGFGSKTYKK
jgi:hypothetical protein